MERQRESLREALKERILIGDGAMGTYLYQLGFPIGVSYEELNVLRPEVIQNVHRLYYEAGARIIETNTYSANLVKLAKYGLEDQMEAINRAGVAIARSAVGEDAFVIGSIGSVRDGKLNNVRTSKVEEAYERQMTALVEAGADGLLLETFYDLKEMKLALSIARKIGDIPVICQFAVEDSGRTRDGVALADAFQQLKKLGADVVGFNCHSGPNGILKAVESIEGPVHLPLSVYPNAGIPDYVDGKYSYSAGAQYFGECARRFADRGVKIIGGCCGTTPEHVAAMAAAIEGYAPQSEAAIQRPKAAVAESAPNQASTAGKFSRTGGDAPQTIVDLVKQRHTVIVELDPPRDLDISRFMAGAAALKAVNADAITMADNSLAVTRMSNLALGALLREQVDITPLVHIAARDRNLIGTQSHMMGLDALGINHVLAVTGDPARFGDLPDSSSVYDLTSFEMIRMIKQLNEGTAFSGKPLKQKANFIVGAAFNPNVKHLDKAVQRLERKVSSGADYIMTQPVYDPELMVRIAEATKNIGVPVFIGIMPLANGRNAEYLHNEVPGIQLSDEVRKRMAGLEGEAGRAEGVRIAQELLDAALPHFNGIYLITPFMYHDMAVQLTRYVWQKTKK
ncbi:bifunctional homocysteine S-methyltransferase/methylenetetrahydrofolate reductase [Paenibacillus oryzae]|nr:bifunctional homocysteine S-methyltransferase/methylenetetrahydrofolate reductase [Paenibacillus oryzae]